MISENSEKPAPKSASRKRHPRKKNTATENEVKEEIAVPEDAAPKAASQAVVPEEKISTGPRVSDHNERNPYAHPNTTNPHNRGQKKVWDIEDEEFNLMQPENDIPDELNIKVTRSLMRKMKSQAQEEGVSLSDYVTELLSEGVVLRAWEIVEKKSQLRGGPVPGMNQNNMNRMPQQGRNQGGGHGGHGGRNKGHRGMSHGRYQTIMDDKASFLEYVRNQERNRR